MFFDCIQRILYSSEMYEISDQIEMKVMENSLPLSIDTEIYVVGCRYCWKQNDLTSKTVDKDLPR